MAKNRIWNMGVRKFDRLFSRTKRKGDLYGKSGRGESKAISIQEIAKEMGVKVVDIKLSEMDPSDLKGLPDGGYIVASGPIEREQINEAIDAVVEERIASPDIHAGDMVLMEYAKGVTETVVVEAIEDGMVYGLGDDGEPFSAPLANCDKVPF